MSKVSKKAVLSTNDKAAKVISNSYNNKLSPEEKSANGRAAISVLKAIAKQVPAKKPASKKAAKKGRK